MATCVLLKHRDVCFFPVKWSRPRLQEDDPSRPSKRPKHDHGDRGDHGDHGDHGHGHDHGNGHHGDGDHGENGHDHGHHHGSHEGFRHDTGIGTCSFSFAKNFGKKSTYVYVFCFSAGMLLRGS